MKRLGFLILVVLAVTLLFSACVSSTLPSSVVKEQVVNVAESGSIYYIECLDGSLYQTRLYGIESGKVYYFTLIGSSATIIKYSLEYPEK